MGDREGMGEVVGAGMVRARTKMMFVIGQPCAQARLRVAEMGGKGGMKERPISGEDRVAEGIEFSETKTGLAGEFRGLGGSVTTVMLGAAQEHSMSSWRTWGRSR